MPLTADFLVQATIVASIGVALALVGLRTLRADRHVYGAVRRRTGSARRAVLGTVGHHTPDSDATVVHGMAVGMRAGKRIIVRNGKIAADSISAC
jgi:hypothetical protein